MQANMVRYGFKNLLDKSLKIKFLPELSACINSILSIKKSFVLNIWVIVYKIISYFLYTQITNMQKIFKLPMIGCN